MNDDEVQERADALIGDLTGLSPEETEKRFRQARRRCSRSAHPNRPGNEAHPHTLDPVTAEIYRREDEFQQTRES